MKLLQRVVVLFIATILVITVYIFYERSKNEDWKSETRDIVVVEVDNNVQINAPIPDKDAKIDALPSIPFKHFDVDKFVRDETERLQLDFAKAAQGLTTLPWKIAASWVGSRQIYPSNSIEMADILYAMSMSKIVKADVLPRGTQLKLLLELEDGQKVVFKQKRYGREEIISGKPYSGFDRHNAEIAAFHLDRLMNFRRSPLVIGRIINLKSEVMPVATEKLLKTFLEKDGDICYYGVCYYCRESEKACADGEMMEGSLTLWLPDEWSKFEKLRHPYQRTYVDTRKAPWEENEKYCNSVVKHKPPYDSGPRLLDITDGAVFDYLIGNADRHHYEVFKDKGPDVMLLMLDNAKSFGNPFTHEQSILAPIRQCCIMRNATWHQLHHLKDGVLTKLLEVAMESDPISPVLWEKHLEAMNHRLPHVLKEIETCITKYGQENVIMNEWKGVGT